MKAVSAYWRRVRGFRRNARLYLVSTILRSLTLGLSSLLFNLYLTSMGFGPAFIGLCNTLLSVGSMLCALPAGLIADRIGRKQAMALGLTGMILAQFGIASSNAGWAIAACNTMYGVVGSFFLTSIAPFLIENSTDAERSTLFTLNASLMNLVSFVVMIAGGYLPRLFATVLKVGAESVIAYRSVMLASACCLVLGLIPILVLQDRHQRSPTSLPRRSVPHLWRRFSNPRLLLKLLIPQTLTAFGAGLVFPFINLFYRQQFGVSDVALGWILGVTSAVAGVVILLGGGVADRWGKIQVMFVARAISVPLLLAIGFSPWLPVAVAAHWARSGFMRVGEPLYLAFAMEQLAENERATGSSLLMMSWDIGWSAGPYVSGLMQTRTGFGPLFLGTTVFYTFGLACIYWFFVRRQQSRWERRLLPRKAA